MSEYTYKEYELAKNAFRFMEFLGFYCEIHREPGLTSSFQDSYWNIEYHNHILHLHVVFTELQLEIDFEKDGTKASYFLIDRKLFSNASGYAGERIL